MSRNGSNPGGRSLIRPLRVILALAILVMNRWSLSHWMYPKEHASPQNGALSFPSKQVNCECGQAWASDLEDVGRKTSTSENTGDHRFFFVGPYRFSQRVRVPAKICRKTAYLGCEPVNRPCPVDFPLAEPFDFPFFRLNKGNLYGRPPAPPGFVAELPAGPKAEQGLTSIRLGTNPSELIAFRGF